MPEKPLLLSPAKSGVLVGSARTPTRYTWPSFFSSKDWRVRIAAFAIGVVMIAVGAADLLSRLRVPEVSVQSSRTAFAPGIVALEPGLLAAIGAIAPASSTPATPLLPTRLVVPALGIDAAVERVKVKDDGSMANPKSFKTVGWYELGAKPGEPGNAVLAGHVNNGIGLSGVFARLGEVEIGERVVVQGEGRELAYVVTAKTQYITDQAPLEDIFTLTGPSGLVLITCEGDWDPESRSYDRRLVVVARLSP
jgi:LPXTG-site transpeptidase (sortase) family protein